MTPQPPLVQFGTGTTNSAELTWTIRLRVVTGEGRITPEDPRE